MKLLILHGWTYHIATWDALRSELTSRGIDYEFLLVPGLTDDSDPVWTMDEYVSWLDAKIGSDKVILYGHSNGGRISLFYTLKHPEKVARLILEDSAGIPPRGMRKLKRDVFRIVSQLVGKVVRIDSLKHVFRRAIRASDYANASTNMRKTMSNLVALDLGPELHRITCPTLIVWGAQDKTTPLIDGELMHARIPGSRMVIIPDARHSPHITHVQQMADLVQDEVKAL